MHSYFSPEALEALQEAYAGQLTTPDEMDVDQFTGLPTNEVSNTSPWHGSVDLWKYPDGKNKLETSPIMYRASDDGDEIEEDSDDIYDEDDFEIGDDEDTNDESLSEEEVDALIAELLSSDEDE